MQCVSQISLFRVSDDGKVLHLLAIARAADIPLTIDDFQEVSDRTPYIADLKYAYSRICKASRTDHDLKAFWKVLHGRRAQDWRNPGPA